MKLLVRSAYERITRQHKFIVGMAVGAALLLVAGPALVNAAIPDTDGKIYACYSTGGLFPRVRIIDHATTATCNSGEVAINWTQNADIPSKLRGNGGVNAELQNADLSYRDLRGINLHNATLDGATFNGSDLSNVNMTGINANGVLFHKANLSNVDMSGAAFIGIEAQGANLTNVDMSDVPSSSYVLVNADSATNFTGVKATHSVFNVNNTGTTPINLTAFDFTDVVLATFSTVDVHGVDFTVSSAGTTYPTTFYSSNMSGVKLAGMALTNGSFTSNDMTGANLSSANLTNVNLNQSDLTGANVTGVVWNNTTCPDGTLSNDHSNTCVGHLIP